MRADQVAAHWAFLSRLLQRRADADLAERVPTLGLDWRRQFVPANGTRQLTFGRAHGIASAHSVLVRRCCVPWYVSEGPFSFR